MSLRSALRAAPTLLRIGFAESIAYRAELLIWVLSTTMPFINLALWSAVARSGPVVSESGRTFSAEDFTAYFLAIFIVRQLTGSWACWEMNFEVKSGKLAMRLLRPIHPLFGYVMENLSLIPMRLVVTAPVVVLMILVVGVKSVPTHPAQLAVVAIGFLGGWLMTVLVNLALGAMALYMESSLKLMDVWLAVYFVLSGYVVPVELFPSGLRQAIEFLPFRYQVGLPTELFIGMHTPAQALPLLGLQWLWVGIFFVITMAVWRGGVRRFAAFGG